MPLALRELQAAFADQVAGRDRADLVEEVVGDSMTAEARLRIHRHHVAHSLGSALAATFPTVHALVGEPGRWVTGQNIEASGGFLF